MKLRQMEALRAVVRTGTTKDAGERISLTQSAVSKLIGQLEDELSVVLFARRGGRLIMTPEGQMIFEDVERILTIVDEMREKSWNTGALRAGKLRIGTMPALAYGLLPGTLARLREDYPNVITVIEEQPRASIEEQVASGYYDIGLITLPTQNDRLNITPLGTVEAVCVMPSDHRLVAKSRVNVSDLEGENVISVDPATLLRHRTDVLFGEARVRRRLTIQTQSTLLACQLARAGNGVAIVHPLIAHSMAPNIEHRPFSPAIELNYAVISAPNLESRIAERFTMQAVIHMAAIQQEMVQKH